MENIVLVALTVFVLWAFVLTPYLVMRTRQKLFVIRDKAFLESVDAQEQEYEQFRERVNLMIRFAERISWARVIVNLYLFRNLLKNQHTPQVFHHHSLRKFHNESIKLVAKLFILRSPLLIFSFSLIVIIFLLKESLLIKLKNLFIYALSIETQVMNKVGL